MDRVSPLSRVPDAKLSPLPKRYADLNRNVMRLWIMRFKQKRTDHGGTGLGAIICGL